MIAAAARHIGSLKGVDLKDAFWNSECYPDLRIVAPDNTSVTPATAHHRPDGGFQNPWAGAVLHGFKDFIRWRLGDQRPKNRPPDPPRNSLPTRHPVIVSPRAARGYRSVTWVGHSSVLLQLGPLNVLTDPVWGERASPLSWIGPRRLMKPGVDFDALLRRSTSCSCPHNHYDHLDAGDHSSPDA